MNKKIISFLGYPIILLLLYSVSFVNIEKIINLDLSNIYVLLFFLYFFFSVLFTIFGKMKKNIFSKEFAYIIQFVLFFCILILPSFFINHNFLLEHVGENNLYLRGYGKIVIWNFAMALIISPLLQFVKHPTGREHLIISRKIFGILSFIFFLKHGLEYYSLEYIYQTQYHMDTPYLSYILDNLLVRYDALSGVTVGILMLILGLSSNKISMRFLGKKWKRLQSLVFPAFLISVVHIAFASRFDTFYIFLICLLVSIRLTAYLNRKQKRTSGKVIGYRCIPCGYIYNEKFGDPDSGIAPGTRFEDIPDNWRCPICGVGKEDFEAVYEGEELFFDAKIYGYKMLTGDVLELKIEVSDVENIEVQPGQFANIVMQDDQGEFTRSYSVVEQKGSILTFAIKLKKGGRGGEFLAKSNTGTNIKFAGVHGEFILNKTKNPKVFIATGTGLSPLMNMIFQNIYSKKSYLFFGVQKEKDLFYQKSIKSIKYLEKHIYLSQEETEKYHHGRIDLSGHNFSKDTEFYICGNPGLVEETRGYLQRAGYRQVYFEIF